MQNVSLRYILGSSNDPYHLNDYYNRLVSDYTYYAYRMLIADHYNDMDFQIYLHWLLLVRMGFLFVQINQSLDFHNIDYPYHMYHLYAKQYNVIRIDVLVH